MAKNSEDYWRVREEEQRKHNIKDEKEFRKELEKMYRATLKEVNDQIYAFFSKYASQNAITMAEAKKRANKLDIEAYAEKAKRYVKEKNFSEQANKEMRIYNLTMKANRLELLKAEIGLELCANADELNAYLEKQLEGRALDEVERQSGILGKSILNNRKFAESLVNASFHNATFSDRIWANQALLRNELSNILTNALIQGRNPRDFISQIRKRFDVSTNNAYRLLVTELARVQTSAQMESFKRNGFDQYTFLALGTACEICRKIDGKHFDVDKANAGINMPPMHPHCRCSTSAYMDDEEYEAWLNSYKDHGLTWDEWKDKQKQLNLSKSADLTSRRKARMEARSNTSSLPINKYGKEIRFSDVFKKEGWKEAKKLIIKLSKEYDTRLFEVVTGASNAAGSVDMGGKMHLSTNKLDTVIHEFAHSLAQANLEKYGVESYGDFWKEIKKVRSQYRRDVKDDSSRWISAYEHSEGKNKYDEFMAEAFTLAKLKQMGLKIPSNYGKDFTYADKVLEIVDRYFKKGNNFKLDIQFFAKKPKDYASIRLGKNEYPRVVSQLNTNLTKDQMKSGSIVRKAIGDYVYTFEVIEFDNYRFISKKRINGTIHDEMDKD